MSSVSRLLAAIAGVGLALGIAQTSHAAVIFEDNFETETYATNTTLDFWTVSDGTVDVVGTGFFPGLCNPASGSSPSPAHCVDMDGSNQNAGKITSSGFSFTPGSYTLTFFAAGNQRSTPSDTMTISIGSNFMGAILMNPFDPWTQFVVPFDVAVANTASIVFNHDGGDNIGILIDNITLSSVEAVPAPGSLLLIGIALAGLGFRRRDRTAH